MTDLQLGSLVIGGGIVVLVYGYNWLQERRYRQQAQKAFSRNQPDVLLDTPKNMVRTGEARRLEPVIQAREPQPEMPPLRAAEPAFEPVRQEPAFAAFQATEPEIEDLDDYLDPQAALAAHRAKQAQAAVAAAPLTSASEEIEEAQDETVVATSLLDPTLDFIAEVHAGELIPAENVPTFPGAKRIVTLGLGEDRHWEVVQHASRNRYAELLVGLQLADRQGALTQEQLNAFCMGVQQFADEFEAVVTFPQRSGKLNAARDLDEFCAGVDVLIGLNIMPSQRPFPMEKVRVLAENSGLVRGQDGQFHYRSDSGRTLFTLSNHDETPFSATSDGLTLLFDVPRVAGGLSVFDYLSDFAQNLAASLGGELADDNGKPLNDASLANIRKQLAGIYAQMDDRGIAAGSMAALRLFA